MAISRIRGEQIKGLVLKNEHLADDAAIEESKLSVNWGSHYQQALITKKVVDYVQVNGTNVGGVNELDLSTGATPIIPATVPHVKSDPLSGEGVIIESPKNKVPIRDAITGNPVLDSNGAEVYGRIEFVASTDGDTAPGKFVLRLFSIIGTTETPFTPATGQTIDWQYAKRFNLDTVSEMFAANEKFAEGVADATAHLNINQLALDLYGAPFSLDRDGNANLSKPVTQTILDESLARAEGDKAVRDDLASTEAGKGASVIGVQDLAGNFTGTTVEAVLAELHTSLSNLSSGDGGAQTSEVTNARGTAGSLDARLDRALNEDGTLKAGKDIHKHFKAYFQSVGGEAVVELANFNVANLPPYQVGDHTLDVYVNGLLQNEGLHYIEVAGGLTIDFGMGSGTKLVAGDIITIKYQVNKVE